jgi:uncharacterized phage infection (PIP) family protein YhgE
VRNLAQRSAQAAKEIKSLIGASVEKVESGSKLVQDAGSTMDEIVASVRRVCDIIGEISAAASEQHDGIGQINAAVSQLDQMTQQNAALVEQSAAAAESLREQAQRLAGVVATFKLDDLGSSAAAVSDQLPQKHAERQAQAVISRVKHQARASAPAPVAAKLSATHAEASKPAAASAASLPRHDDDWETF